MQTLQKFLWNEIEMIMNPVGLKVVEKLKDRGRFA